MLSEIRQTHKEKHCWIPLKYLLRLIDTESRVMFSRSCGEGGVGNVCLMGPEFQFGKTKRILEKDGGDDCTTVNVLNTPELYT